MIPALDGRTRALLLLLFAVALGLRVVGLGHLPGINGDEAWYGVRIAEWSSGGVVLRTPTGNPVNPFYILPLAPLQWLFAPHLWSLRLVALGSGVLAVVLAFFAIRRSWGAGAAALAALVVAFLPQSIAYSRFGWGISQNLFFGWLLLWAAYRGRMLWLLVAFLCALLAHPTNIFLLPALLGIVVGREATAGRLTKHRVILALGVLALAGGVALWRFGARLPWEQLLQNLSSPARWLESLRLWVQLFSGTTVYRYITGAGHGVDALVLDLICGAALLWSLIVAPIVAWRRGERELAALPLGLFAALFVFHLLVGPRGAIAGYERYLLWLIAPVVFNLIAQLRHYSDGPMRWRTVALAGTLAALVFASSFVANYFLELTTSGGRAHPTFRTTVVEPKQALYELWKADRAKQPAPARVYASSWWSYQTLRYLMHHGGDLARGDEIVMLKNGVAMRFDRPTYWISYPREDLHRFVEERPELVEKRYTIKDPRGKAIVYLYRLRRGRAGPR